MSEVLQLDRIDAFLPSSHPFAEVVSRRHLRTEQQDAVVVTAWLCAIADGMGGHDNGALAARTALEVLAGRVTGPGDETAVRADIAAANEAVCALATGRWRSPGTTLVTVTVLPDFSGVVVAWCGDSRAWAVDGDAFELVTQDHAHHFGGGLMRCLGAHDYEVTAEPDTRVVPAGEGLRLLLTTDGVHGGFSDLVVPLEQVVAETLARGLAALVAVGCDLGSDNATAVLLDVDAFVAHVRGGREHA